MSTTNHANTFCFGLLGTYSTLKINDKKHLNGIFFFVSAVYGLLFLGVGDPMLTTLQVFMSAVAT